MGKKIQVGQWIKHLAKEPSLLHISCPWVKICHRGLLYKEHLHPQAAHDEREQEAGIHTEDLITSATCWEEEKRARARLRTTNAAKRISTSDNTVHNKITGDNMEKNRMRPIDKSPTTGSKERSQCQHPQTLLSNISNIRLTWTSWRTRSTQTTNNL